MPFPLTIQELLKQIACETARMAYPGGMSRGRGAVVNGGTKELLELFFMGEFPLETIWTNRNAVAQNYDTWHDAQATAMGNYLADHGCIPNQANNKYLVAAKFLNTFMHQLMKYERFRPLWRHLHLPLDARVFQAFQKLLNDYPESTVLGDINARIDGQRAYEISADDYRFIQKELLAFIGYLNRRPNAEFQITSRIELNLLWL